MPFSEKYGYRKVREAVQIESIDESLRNALWNLLTIHVWENVRPVGGIYPGYFIAKDSNREIWLLCQSLWIHFFKRPIDELDNDWSKVLTQLRKFFFECEWFEAYDFIEFVALNYVRYPFREQFIKNCNAVLEKEASAYRFVGGLIARVTEQEQIDEIDHALAKESNPARIHIRRALELLSDREKNDYRNSIKESISAVESLVKKTVGVETGTLGQLIKLIDDKLGLPKSLANAFSNLYGYTSNEGGIRHALLETETIRFEDAKFFLVVCSAFVNLVEAKIDSPS